MLSAKQQRFADEFSLDHNASRAARAAGYSAASAKVTASRLLTNANVRAAVTVREMDAEKALDATRASVLKGLQEAIDVARQQGNPMAMIAGWRSVAQICGYFSPEQHQVDLSMAAGRVRFETMTDQELMSMAKPL